MDCVVCQGPMMQSDGEAFDRHPGCETMPEQTEFAWRCIDCPAGGIVASKAEATARVREHHPICTEGGIPNA